MQRLRGLLVKLANQNLLHKCQQLMPDMRVVKASVLRSYIGVLTFSAASFAIALGITLENTLFLNITQFRCCRLAQC